MIRILATGFAGLLGLAFGSFLNVCVSRWPAGESVVTPRSHCRACARTLAWWENVPLLSWIVLRGRCRGCAAPISWRYPLVELAVGALWAIDAWQGFRENPLTPGPLKYALQGAHHHPMVPILAVAGQALFGWWMVALAALDAENLWLPNRLTISGMFLGLGFSIFGIYEASWHTTVISDCCFVPKFDRTLFIAFSLATLASIFVAAGLVLLLRWLYGMIRHREGMGLGDVKLMALLAAWLGLPGTLLAFLIGTLLGAIAGIVVILVPSRREDPADWKTTRLPFGTFLCIGGLIASLWGQPIISAYLHWVGF